MLQINNKFNIGDTVYVMYSNKIQKGIIDQMKIHAYKDEISIHYGVQLPYDIPFCKEENIFNTPEEISNHLLKTAAI